MDVKENICGNCFQTVGRGIRHQCFKTDTVANLKNLLLTRGLKAAEQVVSKTLKEFKMIQNSDSLKLSTGGPKLSVNIGQSEKKKKLSSDSLFNLKRDLDLSENAVDTILKHIRKDLGRSGVETHTSQKIKVKSHSLSEFYASENIEF